MDSGEAWQSRRCDGPSLRKTGFILRLLEVGVSRRRGPFCAKWFLGVRNAPCFEMFRVLDRCCRFSVTDIEQIWKNRRWKMNHPYRKHQSAPTSSSDHEWHKQKHATTIAKNHPKSNSVAFSLVSHLGHTSSSWNAKQTWDPLWNAYKMLMTYKTL